MSNSQRPTKGPIQDPEQRHDQDQLLGTTYQNIVNYAPDRSDRWLLVDTRRQRLFLVRDGAVVAHWQVSTALAGLDNRENSGGTPCGVHSVAQKIGANSNLGTAFDSREPTGETWTPEWNTQDDLRERDLILTRILVLDGLEPGINQGPGVDSRRRYIYVHGTNREDLIGQPVSHGCLRMNNQDIIELFEQIEEGDPLVIV